MLIDRKSQELLREKFEKELEKIVDLKIFTREIIIGSENPEYAQYSKELAKEISQISDKIKVEFFSLQSEEAKKLNLNISPTILIGKDLGYSIEYWGAPLGQQFSALVETISLTSRGESGLNNSSKEKLKNIDKDILIEIYISLDSPQCLQAVLLSNKIAIEVSEKVKSRCIDVQEVISRARQFNVSSVPTYIFNENSDFLIKGFQNEEKLIKKFTSYGSTRFEEILAKEREEEKKKEMLLDNPDYPIILNENSFDKAVDKYSFLVIDCWAEWCMPCQMVHPVIESLAKKHQGEIVFGKLNIDENREIANRFMIASIPTLLVFKNGEKVDSIVGALPEKALEKELNKYMEV